MEGSDTREKTFTDKTQNILEFCIFDKKTVHEASRYIQTLQFDNFKALCSFILSNILNSKIFCFLSVLCPKLRHSGVLSGF